MPRCIFIILAKAISCMPTPEIRFWRSSSERSCPSSTAAIHSVAVDRTHNLPLERRTVYYWPSSARAKSSSPMPKCQVMIRCAVGALLRNQRHEKKNQASWLYSVISCKAFFIRFWEEGQYKSSTTGALTFSSLSFVCSTDFWMGWRRWLCLARKG